MKPIAPPAIPGKTDSERFQNALRKVFSATRSKPADAPSAPKKPSK